MKRWLVLVLCAISLMACAGDMGWMKSNVPCTVYAEIGATPENSLIAKRIPDPCQAQKLLVTAAKLGVVWDAYSVGQFDLWVGKLDTFIDTNPTYYDLQQYVMLAVAKFNKELGGTFLILSDLILIFPDKTVMFEKDHMLSKMSVADLKAEVKKLAIIYG